MLKRLTVAALAAALTLTMIAAPAGAKSSKPAKAYWYATKKQLQTADVAMHVAADNSKRLDYIRADAGCAFYRQQSFPGLPVKIKNNKFHYEQKINAYSNKDKVNTQISVTIDAKFKNGKFTGSYTITDPSSECTAAQKAKHKFTAKKRVKQVGG